MSKYELFGRRNLWDDDANSAPEAPAKTVKINKRSETLTKSKFVRVMNRCVYTKAARICLTKYWILGGW